MPLQSLKLNKILLISLTNIGDVVLTLPVMDILIRDFPKAKLSVVAGPKAKTLFDGNPFIHRLYIFDKKQPFYKTLALVAVLFKERFDLVVDLRNTAIPLLISPRYRTSWFVGKAAQPHMKYKHLQRLRSVYRYESESQKRYALTVPDEEKISVHNLLWAQWGNDFQYIVVAPGAANADKRWSSQGFIEVCYHLIKRYYFKIVFVGDQSDRHAAERMEEVLGADALNLCGRTSLVQLGALLQGAALAVVNDSAPMHLASYLDVPVLALFGPSDVRKYGPWGTQAHYLQKNQSCPACRNPKGSFKHECMTALTSAEILSCLKITQRRIDFTK